MLTQFYINNPIMKVWLLLIVLIELASSLSCQLYILQLVTLYNKDKAEFAKQVAGYVASSGKLVDDTGFPNTCIKNPAYSYFTAEVDAYGEENKYTAYLGICFTSKCNIDEMNQYGGIIINTLLNITVFDNSTISFYQPPLETEATTGSIVWLVLLGVFAVIALKDGIQGMFKGCFKQTRSDDDEGSSKYEIQFTEDYDPTLLVIQQKDGFFKRNCIFTKLAQYWIPEQSDKIVAFSSIRILAVPLAFYGYLFYLCNLGSINYFSFNKQIYTQTFSKLAIASYYLPDTLFFISGFIFAKKGLTLIQIENKPIRPLISLLTRKIMRLYPLYILIVIIYWQVSPIFHSGPIWFVYQNQAAQCNSSWWRVLLLIDNWFQNGCYNFAWFIPVQIQLTLLNILILFVFATKKKFGLIALGLSFLSSWILVLTISSPLPSSLETTLSYDSERYFKSTYSHMPFYLLGTLNAYFAYDEKTKAILQKLTQNNILRVVFLCLGAFFILLVVDRPEIWDKILGLQLGLSRTGVFLGMYLLMFCGIFCGKPRKTYLHKLSALSLGVLMIGGIVIASVFWGALTFPYIDGQYLLQNTITNCLIAVPFGVVIAAMVWKKPPKEQLITL